MYIVLRSVALYRRGGVEVGRLPRVREIEIRSPVATDLYRKQVVSALLPNAQQV